MNHGTCIHFAGVQNPCGAGLDIPRAGGGLPCIRKMAHVSMTCVGYTEPTDAQVAEYEAKWKASLDAIKNNACPTCGATLKTRGNTKTTVFFCDEHGLVMRGCRR